MPKILVVDDSWLTRQVIVRILKKDNYEIIETSAALDGLKAFGENHVDAVILDLLMPDMHGIDVLKKMREKNTNIPILIMSADVQETTQQRCYSAGATFFLHKPPKDDVLLYHLKQSLAAKRNQNDTVEHE